MATASADLAKLRVAINSLRSDKPDLAASFRAQDFQALLREGYRDVRDLRGASADDLKELGLDEARIKDLKPGLPSPGDPSLEGLLYAPIPDVEMPASFLSRTQARRGAPLVTHPTRVQLWPCWAPAVKSARITYTTGWEQAGYALVGNDRDAFIITDSGLTGALVSTAGTRVNYIFDRADFPFRFTAQPYMRPSGLQVPGEVLKMDVADIGLVEITGPQRRVLQTTICKTENQLPRTEEWSMPAVWTARRNGGAVPDAAMAQNVDDILAQALGSMSALGHASSIISTYARTWGLWTNKKGLVLITDPIKHDQEGSQTKVSVTELFLWSALCNHYSDKEPYPTAVSPGENPRSPSV